MAYEAAFAGPLQKEPVMSMMTGCFDCGATGKCSSCGGSGTAATEVKCHCGGKAARCVRCNGTGIEVPEKGCNRCLGKRGCLTCSGTGRVDLAKAIRMRQARERQAHQDRLAARGKG